MEAQSTGHHERLRMQCMDMMDMKEPLGRWLYSVMTLQPGILHALHPDSGSQVAVSVVASASTELN
jgi:hypothetical protein